MGPGPRQPQPGMFPHHPGAWPPHRGGQVCPGYPQEFMPNVQAQGTWPQAQSNPLSQPPLGTPPMPYHLDHVAQPIGQPPSQSLGPSQAVGPPPSQPMHQLPMGQLPSQLPSQLMGQCMGQWPDPHLGQQMGHGTGQPMVSQPLSSQMVSSVSCWAQPQELGNAGNPGNLQQLDPLELQRVATPQQATLRPLVGTKACSPSDLALPNSERRVLAVDVDEVLCRCAEAFVLWQTGKVLLDVNECFQICYAHSNAAAREEFFNSEAAVNAQTVPGSFEALQALRALNFEVHAITARPISSQSMTFQFLQRCFPGMISGLHLATPPSSPSKGAIAKSLGACGLVDDQLPHVLEASQKLPAVLFDLDSRYSWTKTADVLPQAVVRKTSWAEVVDWATQTLQPLASQSLGQGTSLAPTAAVPVEALAHAAQAQAVQAASVPVPTVEVRLDCVKAFGLDKDFTFSIHLVLKKGEALTVGRSHQTDAFEKLVPDEDLRSCVSRSHFTISWNGESFSLKRLSVNAMFVDDVMIPQQQEVPLNQGGHIGLCSEANGRSAFLLFRFFSNGNPDPLGEELPSKQSENMWSADLSDCPFYLLCTMSASRDVSHLPAGQRAVALTHGSVMLGRQHQPGLFEGILGPDSVNLTFISRSHLEMNEVESGNFMMRNLSQNPVVVKGTHQVAKDQQSFLSPGDSIEFIAGSDLKCFLRLRLEQTQVQPRVAVPAPATGTFWLELEGSAVREGIPIEHRRVHHVGQGQSLVVGRAYQHELHGSLQEEALAWVSREHFRIEVDHACHGFNLSALSSNPMWRQHANQLFPMEKHDTLPLERGDRIWLYTGASDGQPSGPGNKGTIVWTFCT